MKMLKKLYKYFNENNIIILRGGGNNILERKVFIDKGANDIDIYCKKNKLNKFISNLIMLGFSINKIDKKRIHAYYINNKLDLIFIDIIYDINTDINTNFDIKFNNKFISKYLSNPKNNNDKLNTIRYLVNFKKNKYDFLKNSKYIYTINKLLTISLFKKKFNNNYDDINLFLKRNKFTLTKYLKLGKLINYLINRFKQKYNRFNSGKIFIFLGPDGVGKSTILDFLNKNFGYKYYYLGNFNTYYKDLEINGNKRKIYQIIGKFIQLYIKYIITYIQILKDKLLGYIVIVDRCDRYNIGLNKKHKKYFSLLYRIFPITNDVHIIGLIGNSEEIYNRKKEGTIKNIERQCHEIKEILKKRKGQVIVNSNLQETLNKILKYIYK